MPVFAQMDYEARVQINDMTRFDCSKSFAAKGSVDLSVMTVEPDSTTDGISVFDSEVSNRYLDWVFTDFYVNLDETNNVVKFDEGSGTIEAAVELGLTYSLNNFAGAIAAAMNAEGDRTYTSSISEDNVITISANGPFKFVASPIVTQAFLPVGEISTSQEGEIIEYVTKIVTLSAENVTPETSSKSVYVKCYSEDGDYLYCTDQDLASHESDIMKWVAPGRASFKNFIRRAQDLIMNWLDKEGYVNVYGEKFTKRDIIDREEVREWATFVTLRLIFESIKNATDDVFSEKASTYESLEMTARDRAILRLDINKDGEADLPNEGIDPAYGSLSRR